jgi:hypothetical protein
VPDVTTLPPRMFDTAMGSNYPIASIAALLLRIPSIALMLLVDGLTKPDVLTIVGR